MIPRMNRDQTGRQDDAPDPPRGADDPIDHVIGPDEAWDANDPRRRHDQFAPPAEPCECYCLHCRRTFSSDEIWFQQVINDPAGFKGFWMCPTPNCGGAGFTFDIFPTDPDHPANAGWTYCDDDDGEAEWDEEGDESAIVSDVSAMKDWDPAEPEYAAMDEAFGGDAMDDEDLEGEEWKYGLQPGERPESPWSADARRHWEEEQARYDAPDERPRIIDWKDREDRPQRPDGKPFTDDDIPF